MTELTEIGIRSSVKMEEYPNFDFNWGLVVAQLPKWSLPTLDDTGSNRNDENNEKEPVNSPFHNFDLNCL